MTTLSFNNENISLAIVFQQIIEEFFTVNLKWQDTELFYSYIRRETPC